MGDPLIGQVLQDRYRIVDKLGEGGMGAVYLGEHLKIGRKVAIKVLLPHFAKNPHVVARFHQEARSATAIGHANIIDVLDMGELVDGSSYMVLEFLDGRDWSEDLEDGGPQALGRVARILTQTCEALEAAHAQGIVHRDLKPENIFLIRRHGNPDFVKVLDFGISKMLPRMDDADAKALTGTNMMLGTAYYMSPEQTKAARHVDHRSDIYTLGVIFFQALTTAYPFDDESFPMLIVKINQEPTPKLGEYREDLPPQAQEVLDKLMAKDVAARYQSCAEVRAALEQFLDQDAAPKVRANVPDAKARPVSALATQAPALPASRGPLYGGVAMLVLALGGVGAFVATRPNPASGRLPAAPGVAAAAPDEPETVMITVLTSPPEASITLDGEATANPLTIEAPRDPGVHTLVVSAPGFIPRTERITYVQTREINLALEAEVAEEPAIARTGRRRRRPTETTTTPPTVPTVAEPATPMRVPAAEPTMEPEAVSDRFRGI